MLSPLQPLYFFSFYIPCIRIVIKYFSIDFLVKYLHFVFLQTTYISCSLIDNFFSFFKKNNDKLIPIANYGLILRNISSRDWNNLVMGADAITASWLQVREE